MGATSIAVTSPRLGLGTTTTAIAFADVLTEKTESSTLMIDTDFLTLQLSNYLGALSHSHTTSPLHKSIWDAISMPYHYSFDLFTPIQRIIPELASRHEEEIIEMMKDFDESYSNLILTAWREDYDYIIADFPCDAKNYFPKMYASFDYKIQVIAEHRELINEAETLDDDSFVIINDTNKLGSQISKQIGSIPHSKNAFNDRFMSSASWKDDIAYRSSIENSVKNFLSRTC